MSSRILISFGNLKRSRRGENKWHVAYDCEAQEEILFRIIPSLFPADNPQASESCSHIGLKGNKWCRRCNLGGPEKERESDGHYHAHFIVDVSTLSILDR